MDLTCELLFEAACRMTPDARARLVRAFYEPPPAGEARLTLDRPFVLPIALEPAQVRAALRDAQAFVRALVALEVYAYGPDGSDVHARLMRSLEPGSARLVEQCLYESSESVRRRLRRMDAFLDPNRGVFSAIEVNQIAPLSFYWHDIDQRLAAHVLGELGFSYAPRRLAPRVFDWLAGELHARHPGRELRCVALVSEHGYEGKKELPYLARSCEAAGRERGHDVAILHAYPDEVRLAGGKPVVRGREVDLVWRQSVYLDAYPPADVADYETICAHPEEFLLVNAARSFLTASKDTFALLSDPRIVQKLALAPEDARALGRVLPETVNLAHAPEERVRIVETRPEWVSKPTDSSFGEGVEFGSLHTAATWGRLVEARQDGRFVFQRRVRSPVLPWVEIAPDGVPRRRDVEFDFCPHHVDGDMTGTATLRVHLHEPSAGDRAMNVATGSFLTPFVTP
ncbi:hypothetical protein LVJ94_30025 [Pendulispora rubella]|uniref:Circularly permuted type 2 ATP-grasp protein n=1 Tax=Pendulispora rubella TaxID=2741070 RepID=A0ABZ2KR41_9BACT